MKKVISYLSNSNLAVRTQQRAEFYYGHYRWCLRGYLPEMHCLRELSHSRIDTIMAARREWGRKIQLRQPGSWYWSQLDITQDDVANLHAMCDFLLEDDRERKLVISGSWFYIYSNDQSLLETMAALPWLPQDRLQLTEIELYGQPNTVTRKHVRHRMRSYFRSMILDDRRRTTLGTILKRQPDVRLSPSLQHWVDHPRWSRTLDYHFIDHDDSGIITLLSLIEPRLIRRTLPIVAHK